jgi:hypothetical protein
MAIFTHSELVSLAERWLRERCPVVLVEATGNCNEVPDALGFMPTSILIECKAAPGDFRQDQRKRSRRLPTTGMGAYRYYLAPEGVVSAAAVPHTWGLLTASDAGVRMVRPAEKQESDVVMEQRLLVKAILKLSGYGDEAGRQTERA